MDLRRFWDHVLMTPAKASRAFPPSTLDAIQRAIAESEKRHRGEICFVVEAELTTAQLRAGLSSRDRARELFAARGVWNTEENNGVLIYVLLADHRVEIVGDRGIDRYAKPEDWEAIARRIEGHFRERDFERGSIAGVEAVSALLARHFPPTGAADSNELQDRPVVM